MMNRLNLGFYLLKHSSTHTSVVVNGSSLGLQEPLKSIIVLGRTFELQQEPMRSIIVLHSMFELQQEPNEVCT